MNNRGQGTIEYIIIVAVIIVIGLVASGILIGMLSTGSGISKTKSDLFWMSQPIAVTSSMADETGIMRLAIQNNTEGQITADVVKIDGSEHSLESITLTRNSKSVIDLTGVDPCSTGTKNYTLKITYTTEHNLTKSTDEEEITVPCVNSVNLTGGTASYFNLSGDNNNGHFPIWNTTTNDWDTSNGITLKNNTICFGNTTPCDNNITNDGTNLIFNG